MGGCWLKDCLCSPMNSASHKQTDYKPITRAETLSRVSRRSASSTMRLAHSSDFPYALIEGGDITSSRARFTMVHTSSSESTSKTPSQQMARKRQLDVRGKERMVGSAITYSLMQLSPKLLATARRPMTRLLTTSPPEALILSNSSLLSAL